MAGGPEDHFTDSRELYVLVEGDEWAHVEALDPDAGYWARRFAQLVNWRARGEKAVIEPSSLQLRNSSSSSRKSCGLGRRGRSPRASSRQSRRDCFRTKPRRKKLVRRPQWTRSTSRERHIGRRLHSSPGGTRRSRAGHCSFRLIPAARHSIAWMPVPQAERRILAVSATAGRR
jgi:hypothetical protein